MAKPVSNSVGTLIIPEEVFNAWALSLLNEPTGTFVTLGKVKVKQTNLEVSYTTSTQSAPPPPAEPATTPA